MAYQNRGNRDNRNQGTDQPQRRLLTPDEKNAVVDIIDQTAMLFSNGIEFTDMLGDPEVAQNIADMRNPDYKGYARSVSWLGAVTEGEHYISVLSEVFYPGQTGAVLAIVAAFAEINWAPVNYNTDAAKAKLLELGSERLAQLAKEVAAGVTARTLRERVMLDGSLQRMVNDALEESRKREASSARWLGAAGGTNNGQPQPAPAKGGLLARFKGQTAAQQPAAAAKPSTGLLGRFQKTAALAAKPTAQQGGLLARFQGSKTQPVPAPAEPEDEFLGLLDEAEEQFPEHVGAIRYARNAYQNGETGEAEARQFLADIGLQLA